MGRNKNGSEKSLVPLVVMIGVVIGGAAILGWVEGGQGWQYTVRVLLAMFFLAFSIPKIMRLYEFSQKFAMYDLGAMHVRSYATIYPFVEFLIGLSYLTNFKPGITGSIALFLMVTSAMSVYATMHNHEKLTAVPMGAIFPMRMSRTVLGLYVVIAAMAATALWMV